MVKERFENGVHSITNEQYHSSEGISRSALWKLKCSPLHYWHHYLNPESVKEEPTLDLVLGNLVHTMVLEPETLTERYAVKPELAPLPKVGLLKDFGREEYDRQKAEREFISCANDFLMEEFENESQGKEILSGDIFDKGSAMAQSVFKNELASNLFDGAKIEQSIYFTHQPTGLQCKVRPDAWSGSIVTDLKTAKDASLKAFQSSAYHNGYFLQAGMIYQALQSIGITMEKFVFMCVEKKEPYPTATYVLDEDAIDYGVNVFDELMGKLKECCEQDRWPSYSLRTLSVPRYAMFDEV